MQLQNQSVNFSDAAVKNLHPNSLKRMLFTGLLMLDDFLNPQHKDVLPAFPVSMNETIFRWGKTFGDDGEKQRRAYIKALKFANRGKLRSILKFAQM